MKCKYFYILYYHPGFVYYRKIHQANISSAKNKRGGQLVTFSSFNTDDYFHNISMDDFPSKDGKMDQKLIKETMNRML